MHQDLRISFNDTPHLVVLMIFAKGLIFLILSLTASKPLSSTRSILFNNTTSAKAICSSASW